MINERILAALAAAQSGQSQQAQPSQPGRYARVLQAMGRRGGRNDARYASLAALKPYAESKHADQFGGGHNSGAQGDGAFQSEGGAYQDDAYQV